VAGEEVGRLGRRARRFRRDSFYILRRIGVVTLAGIGVFWRKRRDKTNAEFAEGAEGAEKKRMRAEIL